MLSNQFQSSMSLKTLLKGFVASEILNQCDDVQIGGLAIDSRKAQKDDLFFACQGDVSHGLTFADVAIKNGANSVIWDECENCFTNHFTILSSCVAL